MLTIIALTLSLCVGVTLGMSIMGWRQTIRDGR